MATKKIIAEQIKRLISSGSPRYDDNIDLRELMKLVDDERDRLIKEEIILKRNSGDFTINSQYLTKKDCEVKLYDYKTPHPYWLTSEAIPPTISLPNDLEIYDVSYRVFGTHANIGSLNNFSPQNQYGMARAIRKPSNAGVLYDDPSIYNFVENSTNFGTSVTNYDGATGPQMTAFQEDTSLDQQTSQDQLGSGPNNTIPDGYDWTNRLNRPTTTYVRNHFWEYTPDKKIKITNISQPYTYNSVSYDYNNPGTAQSASVRQVAGTIGTLSRSKGSLHSKYIGLDVIGNPDSPFGTQNANGVIDQTGKISLMIIAGGSNISENDIYPVPSDKVSSIVGTVAKLYMEAGAVYPQKFE
jgi:hypothetical protein